MRQTPRGITENVKSVRERSFWIFFFGRDRSLVRLVWTMEHQALILVFRKGICGPNGFSFDLLVRQGENASSAVGSSHGVSPRGPQVCGDSNSKPLALLPADSLSAKPCRILKLRNSLSLINGSKIIYTALSTGGISEPWSEIVTWIKNNLTKIWVNVFASHYYIMQIASLVIVLRIGTRISAR